MYLNYFKSDSKEQLETLIKNIPNSKVLFCGQKSDNFYYYFSCSKHEISTKDFKIKSEKSDLKILKAIYFLSHPSILNTYNYCRFKNYENLIYFANFLLFKNIDIYHIEVFNNKEGLSISFSQFNNNEFTKELNSISAQLETKIESK